METVPKPGSNVPPKKDRLQAKKKVGISLGWKGSFYLRGSRGGGEGQRNTRDPALLVETAAILGARDHWDSGRSFSRSPS